MDFSRVICYHYSNMKSLSYDSEVFLRGVEDIITKEELRSLIQNGKRLRIKLGIDATGDLHIGHAVSLWKIRQLQEVGHKAVILIGDITTQIGDPTGKAKTRSILSTQEISQKTRRIIKSLKKILLTNSGVFELRKSSEWYGKMKAPEFIGLLSNITHSRLIERDMFKKRIAEHSEIHMHELIYPILQGYDSVMLKSDLTIIGSDQLLNEHLGRALQEKFGQKPQIIVACKILPGIDGGEKMSKSTGNFIGIEDDPSEKFGKAMRIPDRLIIPYLEVYSDVPLEQIKKLEQALTKGENPKNIKIFLAAALMHRDHAERKAEYTKKQFLRIFSKKELLEIPEVKLLKGDYPILDLLVKLNFIPSRAEGRRLIAQGAVEVDNRVLNRTDEIISITKELTVKVGKRKFIKAVPIDITL